MSILISTHHSEGYFGRAYPEKGFASLFIKTMIEIALQHSNQPYKAFAEQFIHTYFHEFLHIFFTNNMGKWGYSCKTKIDPISDILTDYFWYEDTDFKDFLIDAIRDQLILMNDLEAQE